MTLEDRVNVILDAIEAMERAYDAHGEHGLDIQMTMLVVSESADLLDVQAAAIQKMEKRIGQLTARLRRVETYQQDMRGSAELH